MRKVIVLFGIVAIAGLMGSNAAAPASRHVKVQYSFQHNGKDGNLPNDALIFDGAGNLYGTTAQGGSDGVGAVIELSPKSGGSWTESVLYSFRKNGKDGRYPVSGLIFDKAGNLYGTTTYGVSRTCFGGCGIVFELSPKAGGGWSEKVLYAFVGGNDGGNPFYSGVVLDKTGNLYGTTFTGGTGGCDHGCGTVFELSPQSGGPWSESVLYSFGTKTNDGQSPYAGVIFDNSGNLYGTTSVGGGGTCGGGCGAVFELSPNKNGTWTESVLYSFVGNTDGLFPIAGLVFDGVGNLYGTTEGGASAQCNGGCGIVFELSPQSGGGWIETVLHAFQGTDGGEPSAGLVLDAAGNLYGTTTQGGSGDSGTVFELVRKQGGHWAQKLYSFQNNGVDGTDPSASLVFDGVGNLLGTTAFGGKNTRCEGGRGCGTVFEVTK